VNWVYPPHPSPLPLGGEGTESPLPQRERVRVRVTSTNHPKNFWNVPLVEMGYDLDAVEGHVVQK
jgi:hypothetical protein